MGFIEETGAAQHLSRRAHPADLRGHQRHPGHRPRHAQAAAGRRQGGRGLHRRAEETVRRGARLQPPRVRPHGRAARRGRRGAGRGDAAGWAAPCRRTRRPRWPAPRPTCACSASPPAASTSPRARWPRPATAPATAGQPIAIARFFAENLATAAPGLKDTVSRPAPTPRSASHPSAIGVDLPDGEDRDLRPRRRRVEARCARDCARTPIAA